MGSGTSSSSAAIVIPRAWLNNIDAMSSTISRISLLFSTKFLMNILSTFILFTFFTDLILEMNDI